MLAAGQTPIPKKGLSKRVLIVEDDPVSALLLRRVLEQRGYTVDQADNGLTALEVFHQHRHGIVISDWMMPEMDGMTFTRELRQISGQYVYVVLLSAKGQRDDRLEAFDAGVDDFLTKPLDREELYARLKVAERILSAEEALRRQREELRVTSDRLKLANHNLQVASRRFEELFTGVPAACFTFDAEGVVHEWNRAAEEFFGIPAHQAIMRNLWDNFGERDSGFWSPTLVDEIFHEHASQNMEWSFERGPETERHLMCSIFVLRGSTGEIIGAISANLDITERLMAQRMIEEQKHALEDANLKLSKLAVTDGLTGLWNHRRFREEIEVVHAAMARRNEPMSLVFLDVDHFKGYNDSFGHPAGDEVLKRVAQVLRETARSGEAVARYGGEEFAIIMPSTSSDQAIAAAERLRVAIESANWPLRLVTASLGVATLTTFDGKVEDLVLQADLALYAAKHSGRNQAQHYDTVGAFLHTTEHQAIRKTA